MANFYYRIPNKVIADYFIARKENDLLSIGANLDNIESKSILEHILNKSHSMREVVYAVKNGVNINTKNSEGKSLLDICQDDYLRSKILRQHGAK